MVLTTYITDYFKHSIRNDNPVEIHANSTKLHVVTFNCQTLEDGHRLQVMINEFKRHKVDVAIIQGTCWDITISKCMGEYMTYHFGKQSGMAHKQAGVMICVHTHCTTRQRT